MWPQIFTQLIELYFFGYYLINVAKACLLYVAFVRRLKPTAINTLH